MFTKELIENAYSYAEYRKLTDELLAEGKTTGLEQTPELTEYTRLNVKRMSRWDKTAIIENNLIEKLKNYSKKEYWLVLTESWCGDAAQNIPFLIKIVEYAENITIKFLLRDENPEIMNQFLTNGGKSIPKLIRLDENLNLLNHWGPRPQTLQNQFIDFKNKNMPKEEIIETVHKWYFDNKGKDLQNEFLEMLNG
ncbi:MAG: thioredoxin family protein [Bacteroidetes bacterium]|nr:MAG: thioredoxin family protein [Bacteroidota bacterium]TAG87655.1 MAG: thioredoxin family protein [Bacteroidota bacterium]